MQLRGIKTMARTLLVSMLVPVLASVLSFNAIAQEESNDLMSPVVPENAVDFKMTAKLAHELITQQQANLLGDGSQLVSLYYFGQNQLTSVVGLERVGDDYLPIRWLLVFESSTLVGWYYPVGEFPAKFNNGHLAFPRGASAEDIYLFPHPPSVMTIEGVEIPFVTPQSASALTLSKPAN